VVTTDVPHNAVVAGISGPSDQDARKPLELSGGDERT